MKKRDRERKKKRKKSKVVHKDLLPFKLALLNGQSISINYYYLKQSPLIMTKQKVKWYIDD